MSTHFAPAASLIGGLLIGGSAALLLLYLGRIAGVTGIIGGVFRWRRGDLGWRLWFLAGLVAGGALLTRLRPGAFAGQLNRSGSLLLIAGLMVGYGTRMGNGCTSGHGVCGIGRLSKRSLAATVVFIATGALTVWLLRNLKSGAA